MRRKILFTAVVIAALTGCATSKQADETNRNLQALSNQLSQLAAAQHVGRAEQGALQTDKVCYLGTNQVYSPGAVVEGRTCADLRQMRWSNEPAKFGWQPFIRTVPSSKEDKPIKGL